MYDILELSKKLLPELREIGKELNIKRVESFKKQDLIYKILDNQAIMASGIKKPEIKVVPRLIRTEESDITNKENSSATVITEKKASAESTEIADKQVVAERQPLIRPFPKRIEKPRLESLDSKERRPRVFRTDPLIITSSPKLNPEVEGCLLYTSDAADEED